MACPCSESLQTRVLRELSKGASGESASHQRLFGHVGKRARDFVSLAPSFDVKFTQGDSSSTTGLFSNRTRNL